MKKPMPFDFLLDELPKVIIIKPAIGMFYVYFNGRIVLIFKKTAKNLQHNGIWISTTKEHHDSLKTDVPAITEFDLEKGLIPSGCCSATGKKISKARRLRFAGWSPARTTGSVR